ncbi:MAG: DegT/DnrJ/EryC1/StrS family aminotransferase [Lachnospiraceae bacterium]|nr:DegT/DnrJ/EryC1/StrS family aminotransferase [Lachnospiraceae bacterium]
MSEKIMVTRSSLPPLDEYIDEIKSMWESHWLTNMGPKHNRLQKELCDYLGVSNIELVVNGHMALEMTLQAMALKGEVITTPFTFVSTTHAIVRNGLKPVFCDINPEDYTIDVSKLASLLSADTCAILPVHVYGNVCNVDEIADFAKKHGLKVIYDAAHTFGETYKGKGIGSYGDASCFSFHATKVFNTIEGGCVCYKEDHIGEKIYDLKDFGIHGPEEVSAVGANAKMNEFCAAMGLCNLKHVDECIKMRGRVYERYNENLDGIKGIKLNKIQKNVKSNYAYYPVVFEPDKFGADRDFVFERLYENGIMARKYFYPATNAMTCYEGRFNSYDTPVAGKISERVLTLPIYPELEPAEVDRICKVIRECGN